MVDIQTTPEAQTAEARRQAQTTEYGKYRAAEPIMINGALAFNPGYPVPISHTEEYPQLLEVDEATGRAPVVTVEEWEAMEAEKAAEPSEPPHAGASRTAWVEHARSAGADEAELAPLADGGLGRNELAAKYGPDAKKPTKKKAASSSGGGES